MKYFRIPRISTVLGFNLCVEVDEADEEYYKEITEQRLELLREVLINALVAHGCSREVFDLDEAVKI